MTTTATAAARIAFVHPGQGSHRPSMLDHWKATPQASLIDHVADALGRDLWSLGNDADACAASTAVGQPAILAASLAAANALALAGVVPGVVAGHSLGEVTAANTVGALDLDAVARLVVERGQAMGDACHATPGGMAAVVRLDRAAIDEILADHPDVAVANQNAQGQVVVSGAQPALDTALGSLRAAGGRAIPLQVEGAFHSPAMAPAVVRVDDALARLTVRTPFLPLVTGTTGHVVRDATEVRRVIVDGILRPVQWVGVQDRLLAMGVEVVVEVGPGGVLAALARRAHPQLRVLSCESPRDVESVAEALAPVSA